MAISDEIRHQRKRLKGKGVKAHVSYFLTYYTWPTIGVLVGIGMVVWILATALTSKNQVLGVIMLNASTTSIGADGFAEMMESEFAEYAGIDTSKDRVVIDTTTYQTPGVVSDTYDMSTSQKVSVQAAAQTLDAVVADASNFYYYTFAMAFDDLRDVLPQETLDEYADYIYYVDLADVNAYQEEVESAQSTDGPMTYDEGAAYEKVDTFVRPDPEEMEDPVPVGVIVTDAPVIAESGVYTDRVVIYGFVQGSQHVDYAAQYLDYLWQE